MLQGSQSFILSGVYGYNDGTFLIDPAGAVYVDFQLDVPAGENIDRALVRLLLGIRWW